MNYFILLAVFLFLYITFLFVISIIKKRNDIADIGWGLGFSLLVLISFYFNFKAEGLNLRSFLVTGLVVIWGLRLSSHIYFRNRSKEEDYRYKKWREEHKQYHKKYSKLYYQENKAERNQYAKLYYQEHKENINESIKQPVKCPICNSIVTRQHLKRHQRSKKCQEYLNK